MCNYWITMYDVQGKKLFRMKVQQCSQDWAIDEAEELKAMCPEADRYNVSLAI